MEMTVGKFFSKMFKEIFNDIFIRDFYFYTSLKIPKKKLNPNLIDFMNFY
jgi:hypothetical protein